MRRSQKSALPLAAGAASLIEKRLDSLVKSLKFL
jgi:hypothetical protein